MFFYFVNFRNAELMNLRQIFGKYSREKCLFLENFIRIKKKNSENIDFNGMMREIYNKNRFFVRFSFLKI